MIILKKECPNCGTLFEGCRSDAVYCSRKCQQRANSKRYYREHKHLSEFRDKRKKTFLDWVKKNNEHYLKLQEGYRKKSQLKSDKQHLNTSNIQ